METNEMKTVMRKILEGEFDDELRDLQDNLDGRYYISIEIPINDNLAKQIDEIMNKRGFSVQDFLELSFIKILLDGE